MGSRPQANEHGNVLADESKELSLPLEVKKWAIFEK
jgi:hypothetical protein